MLRTGSGSSRSSCRALSPPRRGMILEEDLGLDVLVRGDAPAAAAVRERAQGLDLVAQRGGSFKVEVLGGRLHLRRHLAENFTALGIQEALQTLDVLAVGVLADLVGTGGGALLDRVEQARPRPVGFFWTVELWSYTSSCRRRAATTTWSNCGRMLAQSYGCCRCRRGGAYRLPLFT